jgi:hypothetical protein
MKTYLSLLAIGALFFVAQPASALVVDTLTNINITLSKSTSSYQTTSFEQIGIVASAADQDGLKLLTVQRYTVTGALTTLGTTACERQKGCAVVTSLTPTDRDANSTISLLIKATDINGNERTSRSSINVGGVPVRDTTAPSISLMSGTNTNIIIPRDASSATIAFKTQFSDASLIDNVSLLKRYNGERNFNVANTLFDANGIARNGRSCPLSSPCQIPTTFTVTNADVGRQITFMAEVSDMNDNIRDSELITFTITKEATTDRTAPTGSITATPNSFTVDSGSSPIVSLSANVTDNTEIKSVRFYRTNPQTGSEESVSLLLSVGSVGINCNTTKTSCTASNVTHAFSNINFTDTSPAYYNVPYYAIIKDAAGNETRTASVNVRLNKPTTTSTRSVPTVTITPSRTTAGPSNTITLSASATSDGGVYAVEVRALPSWSSVTTKKRCTLSSTPRTGTCSLDIGPYTTRTEGTIKVWAIAWDNASGLGGNSGEKTVTLTIR